MVTIARLFLLATLASSVPVRAEEPSASPVVPAAAARSAAEWRLLARDLARPQGPERAAAEKAVAGLADADVKALVSALRGDRDRLIAGSILHGMGSRALSPLLDLLQDPDLSVRAAGLVVDAAGPGMVEAAPRLLACLRSRSDVRLYCGQALVKLSGPAAKKHVPALVEALSDPDADVRAYAATALGLVGKGASGAKTALQTAAKDADPAVRAAALKALGRLRG